MKRKKITVSELIKFLGKDLLAIKGDYSNVYVDNLADVDRVNETTLDWINPQRPDKARIIQLSKAKVMLVDSSFVNSQDLNDYNKILLVVKNPKKSLAQIGNNFYVEKVKPSIDPSVIIDKNAIIGENVYIGPNCVIGKSRIGENCIIDANVCIYDEVTIGPNCMIKAGAVLGGVGFGFEKDENGDLFRFPQIGRLIIGNNVEIGSNTTIDRGALSDTRIGDFTKINNLCHIAHNNIIGKNVIIAGCVNISGSNIIEDNVLLAPNSSIRGWLKVGEGATIGMGAVVTKNVPKGETWIGNPARKLVKNESNN